MYPRNWWATLLVIGAIVALAFPFLLGSTDPVLEGLVKASAWVLAVGAVHGMARWTLRRQPADRRPDGEPQ